jgi:ubiquitin-conjugating enzyme E2 J1
MSTRGQFGSKNPTIKRIMKEASELANQPSSDYHAAPLENDIFEWHFTLRGPPTPSPFEGGVYHGRIVLPPAYPLKPPSFRFLTPTGRFEVNREICLSISGHHEETWQPAWGIRTALVAIRSFMDTSASGQLGGMDASEEVRKRVAGQSTAWKCPTCGKSNAEIMREQDEAVKELGEEGRKEEVVPEELRLAYREDLSKDGGKGKEANGQAPAPAAAGAQSQPAQRMQAITQPSPASSVAPAVRAPAPAAPQVQPARPPQAQQEDIPAWIDKAIYGVVLALLVLIWRRWSS